MNHVWVAINIDVKGACFQSKFENGEELYTKVTDGFKELYPGM